MFFSPFLVKFFRTDHFLSGPAVTPNGHHPSESLYVFTCFLQANWRNLACNFEIIAQKNPPCKEGFLKNSLFFRAFCSFFKKLTLEIRFRCFRFKKPPESKTYNTPCRPQY